VIRVGLVDDQQMVRVGLRMILESAEDIEVCCEAATGAAAIELAAQQQPDVLLMDIRMPEMDGLAATAAILKAHPDIKVVILTTFDDDEYLYGALRAGASGFLLKSADGDSLINAVRVVASGEALLAPEVTRRVIEQFTRSGTAPAMGGAAASELVPADEADAHVPSPEAVGDLSERELEVLQLMARGLSNQEIAAELFVSNTTVKTHVSHILTKLGVRDRVQAVVEAYDSGIVLPRG
jgi:DNA-binding NarL/FixJ family response regulator